MLGCTNFNGNQIKFHECEWAITASHSVVIDMTIQEHKSYFENVYKWLELKYTFTVYDTFRVSTHAVRKPRHKMYSVRPWKRTRLSEQRRRRRRWRWLRSIGVGQEDLSEIECEETMKCRIQAEILPKINYEKSSNRISSLILYSFVWKAYMAWSHFANIEHECMSIHVDHYVYIIWTFSV